MCLGCELFVGSKTGGKRGGLASSSPKNFEFEECSLASLSLPHPTTQHNTATATPRPRLQLHGGYSAGGCVRPAGQARRDFSLLALPPSRASPSFLIIIIPYSPRPHRLTYTAIMAAPSTNAEAAAAAAAAADAAAAAAEEALDAEIMQVIARRHE